MYWRATLSKHRLICGESYLAGKSAKKKHPYFSYCKKTSQLELTRQKSRMSCKPLFEDEDALFDHRALDKSTIWERAWHVQWSWSNKARDWTLSSPYQVIKHLCPSHHHPSCSLISKCRFSASFYNTREALKDLGSMNKITPLES